MRFEHCRMIAAAGAAIGLLLAAGCAVQAPAEPSQARREAERQAPVAPDRSSVAESAARAEAVESSAAVDDAITRILADRRRGDYPEIELLESGFTITEQARIGNEARGDYERALGLFAQERYAEGISILEDVIATAPDVTAPYVDLAVAYRRIDDLEHAEEALATAALLSPDNPVVHNELGILYRRTGRFGDARASYEKALEVFGDFHYARRNLAILCDLYLADLECALENYRAYLASAGSDAEVEIWVADIENRLVNN